LSLGVLYGSAFSPYVRICRLVSLKSGALVDFRLADPFDPDFRAINPLGKVPALVPESGPLLLDTGLICRTLMAQGRDLLPKAPDERLEDEALIAVLTGVLDLGVAFVMESRRDADVSEQWQRRRLEGIERAYPLIEKAAERGGNDPDGYLAMMLVSVLQWLDFRLGENLSWRSACPQAEALADRLAADPDVRATAPGNA
jgi:glutathione S-transferase